MKMKKFNTKVAILAILLVAFTLVVFDVPQSISRYVSEKNGSKDIDVAKFQPKLNGSTNLTQSIDLANTITANNYSDNLVAPGTNGDIVLTLDFSNVDVSTDYVISVGNTDLPTNLNLYSDSSYTTAFSTINGTYTIGNSTTHTQHIYWKWEYLTDSASDTNDNLYMNHNLSIPVTVTTSQKVGAGN